MRQGCKIEILNRDAANVFFSRGEGVVCRTIWTNFKTCFVKCYPKLTMWIAYFEEIFLHGGLESINKKRERERKKGESR